MSTTVVDRDERTVVVENASYRAAYLVLTFGLLVLTAVRSFVWQEQAWDLLGLVLVGGLVGITFQAGQRVLTPRWAYLAVAAAVVGAVAAAWVAWIR
jgi:1,4-dihydroxy-2-naphthoate octaprenyltransferase